MWLCKRDLSRECEGKYKDCTDCVLDKIRAEIEKIVWEDIWPIFDDTGEITDEIRTPLLNPDDVFEIIDKYKADERSVKSEDDL